MSIKNSNDTSWDRTSDLPICSTVTTVPPRAPFYDVTAVNKFDSRLVIKEILDMWWPVERRSCVDRNLGYDRIYILPRSSSRLLRESTQVVKVIRILLSSELCLCFWNSPPVDVTEWWYRNESSTCHKIVQGVWKYLKDIHNADTTFRHSTPVTYVHEACVVEPILENRRGNQIQNRRKWKQLYGCKHRNADFRGKRIFLHNIFSNFKNLDCVSYVYWTVHHLDSWIKGDQLDVTCFFISLFNAQHVSDVNTSILRSWRLICWFISWVVLFWSDACWCYVEVWLGWCGNRIQAASGYHTTPGSLTSVHHLSLSWASPIQSIYPHPTSWRSILILFNHLRLGLPSGSFPPVSPPRPYTPPLLTHTRHMPSPSHSSRFYHPHNIGWGVQIT